MRNVQSILCAVAVGAALGGCSSADADTDTVSVASQGAALTLASPYLVASTPGVSIEAIITAGEAAGNGYRMVGTPDGLGAFSDGNEFTVLMNHELSSSRGIVRAHGSKGSFVSKWTIDKNTLEVVAGEDLNPTADSVYNWDGSGYVQGTTVWNRFCSADLAPASALRHGNKGTTERVFFGGEEVPDGRSWARIVTGPEAGQAWQLPHLGRLSTENVLLNPDTKDKTVAAVLEDWFGFTQLSVYVGDKQSTGSTIERIGLTNGKLYGVKINVGGTAALAESDDFGFGDTTSGFVGSASFELVELGDSGDVSSLSAEELAADQEAKGIFGFNRTEDGAWDPRGGRSNDLYFATTGSSRLFRLRFDDIRNSPEAGGEIEILLTGNEGQVSFDNITVDGLGRVVLQEDPGRSSRLAKIWVYGIDTGEFVEVAEHNPTFFSPESPDFITTNEESSGIIDAHDIFGQGWFIAGVMVGSTDPDPEIVAGGQLLRMYIHPSIGRTGL